MAISGLSLPNLLTPRDTTTQSPTRAAGVQDTSGGSQTQESYQASAQESGSGSSVGSLLGGFLESYGPKLNLDEGQLKQIRSAAPHLQRAAGADGKWGPEDLADNVQAFKGGRFSPLAGVVERSLREGFEEMTGKPVPPLTQEQKDAALERWNAMSEGEKRQARLTAPQLKSIGTALNAVKGSTPLTALGGKSESIPGNFLSKVAEKPTLAGLLEAKKGNGEAASGANEGVKSTNEGAESANEGAESANEGAGESVEKKDGAEALPGKEATSAEDSTTAQEPATADEAGASVEEPGVSAKEPGVSAEEPEVSVEEPEVSVEEPGVSAEEPAEEPEVEPATEEEPPPPAAE